jgi:hypothetical protein
MSGDEMQNLEFKESVRSTPFLARPKLAKLIGLPGAPYAVWLDPDGKVVAKGLASGVEDLESLRNARRLGVTTNKEYHEKYHRAQA